MKQFFTHTLRGIIRGFALFLGLFSGVNILISQFGVARTEDVWWIDLSFLTAYIATPLSIICAILLVGFAIKPHMRKLRRTATVSISILYALFALLNVILFYKAAFDKSIIANSTVPFSLIICVLFLIIAVAAYTFHTQKSSALEHSLTLLIALVLVGLFPLAQIATFGHVNYERPSDMTVVFGARVYRDGTLSVAVHDRVSTAIDLYKRGLTKKLYMTGGVDADGVNEAKHMKKYAVKQGVPATDIIVDSKGMNTDASVVNSSIYIRKKGYKTVLAVSQPFHLPRIKMAYRAMHQNIYTVPAAPSLPIGNIVYTTAREIPAFWVYWLRSGLRDIRP